MASCTLRPLNAYVSENRKLTSVGVALVPQSSRVRVTSAGVCADAVCATSTLTDAASANDGRMFLTMDQG